MEEFILNTRLNACDPLDEPHSIGYPINSGAIIFCYAEHVFMFLTLVISNPVKPLFGGLPNGVGLIIKFKRSFSVNGAVVFLVLCGRVVSLLS